MLIIMVPMIMNKKKIFWTITVTIQYLENIRTNINTRFAMTSSDISIGEVVTMTTYSISLEMVLELLGQPNQHKPICLINIVFRFCTCLDSVNTVHQFFSTLPTTEKSFSRFFFINILHDIFVDMVFLRIVCLATRIFI